MQGERPLAEIRPLSRRHPNLVVRSHRNQRPMVLFAEEKWRRRKRSVPASQTKAAMTRNITSFWWVLEAVPEVQAKYLTWRYRSHKGTSNQAEGGVALRLAQCPKAHSQGRPYIVCQGTACEAIRGPNTATIS